jgi:predicted metal-binding membrane protein
MTAGLVLGALRHDRWIVLGGLVAVILLAWAYLLLGAGVDREMMDMGGGRMMAMAPAWTPGYAALVFVMWAIMMLAMMLPGATPVFLLVAALERKRSAAGGRAPAATALFGLGYAAVWFGFSGLATALQWSLDRFDLLTAGMAAGSAMLAGAVLVAAGIYQWMPLKDRCLSHCRSPLDFLLHHWRPGAWGALRSGFGHGAFCLGCCWMLMALLFVGGLMNLLWVAGLALLVLVEKTVPGGPRVGRFVGAALVVWGVVTLTGAA